MTQIAQLREQIQSRKFQVMNLDVKVSNLANEIRFMVGTRLTPNNQIPFEAIINRATEASGMMKLRASLRDEITTAERDLEE